MTAALLEVAGLDAFYGRAQILSGVALDVAAGEVVALLGRNGAGKSTTLKAIIGLVRPAAGAVRLRGNDIAGAAAHAIAQAGIGYVPEDRRIFADLTVLENLEVGRQPPRDGVPHWTRERVFELFPALGDMRSRLGGRMSGGEQQMLTIARTLMGNPALLLLDEPSEGLAPRIVEQMAATLLRLKADGLAILLSEQNLHFAGAVADRAPVLAQGRVRYTGTMAALAADESVRRAFLSV